MPEIGHSVGAASGVANGGLMFQLIILFPIWGGILGFWTKRKSRSPRGQSNVSITQMNKSPLSNFAAAVSILLTVGLSIAATASSGPLPVL